MRLRKASANKFAFVAATFTVVLLVLPAPASGKASVTSPALPLPPFVSVLGPRSGGGTFIANVTVGGVPAAEVFDPVNGYVYVLNSASNNVSVLSRTSVIANIDVGDLSQTYCQTEVERLAVDSATGDLYVANAGSANVSVISGTTLAGTIALSAGSIPCYIAFDPNDTDVYVSLANSGSISVLHGTSLVSTLATVSPWPEGLVYDPWNGYMYAAVGGLVNCVELISGTSFVGRVNVGNSPSVEVFDPQNGNVYVANYGSQNVSVVRGLSLVGTIPTAGAPQLPVVDPHTGVLYVIDSVNPGTVLVANGTSSIGQLSLGPFPEGMAYDPSTRTTLVADVNGTAIGPTGYLGIVNGTAGLGEISLPVSPVDALYDPISSDIYVTDADSDQVSILGPMTPPKLTQVDVSPASASVTVGGTADFNVSARCSPWGCPSSPTWSWTLTNALGALNSTSNSWVQFTAGSVPGQVTLFVNGSLGGTVVQSTNVLVQITPGPVLASVSAAPTSASLATGGSASFTATPTCTGGPCPAGTTFAWSMNRALGTFNATTGSVVKFTAGASPGTTYLFVNATLSGVTVQSAAIPVTITSHPPPRWYNVTFVSHPASCGLTFNTSLWSNASVGMFRPAAYLANANSCAGFTFHQWNVSGGLYAGTPNGLSTTVDVANNGTLTADYTWSGGGPPPRYTLTFSVNHAACSPIEFNGTSQANGTSSMFLAGTFEARAPACSGYAFDQWSYFYVSSSGSGNRDTWVNASNTWANYTLVANGTLAASYAPSPTWPTVVGVTISPSNFTSQTGWQEVLNATAICSGGPCPSGTEYSWSTNNPALWNQGRLTNWSRSNLLPVIFGPLPTTGIMFVNVTLGVAPVRSAPDSVTLLNTLEYVGILSNGPDNLTRGATTTLSGWIVCYGGYDAARGDCPPGTTYAWALGNGRGSLNSSSTSTVRFTAGNSPGVETIYLNVTDEGITIEARLNVTILASLPGLSLLGLSEADSVALLVGVAAAVLLAVVVVVLGRRRKRKEVPPSSPEPPSQAETTQSRELP